MSEEYKPINNLWKDSKGYRYFGTLKLSSKIKYNGDDFIPLWEWVKQLQQENKILRENAEHNDKVVDKVNWENMLLKKENKQLKEKLDCDLQWAFKYDKQVDNWNKLKEIMEEETREYWNTNILEIMQKIEQGSDSNE